MNNHEFSPKRNSNMIATGLLVGGIGGYTYGFVHGLINNASFHQCASFAGRTFISGILAGLLGFSVYYIMKLVRFFNWVTSCAIAAACFESVNYLQTKPFNEIEALGSFDDNFLPSLIGGLVIGAVGGAAISIVLQILIKNKIKTK